MNPLEDQSAIQIIGPFAPHSIASVNGFKVPYLEITEIKNDETKCNLTVGPFGICMDWDDARSFIPFLAHAMAYSAGYSSHGEFSQSRNDHAVRLVGITDAA